jgi:hypothetical protein
MSIDRILAMVGIAVSAIGVAVAVLVPTVRIVGWLFLGGGILIVLAIPVLHFVTQAITTGPTRQDWREQEARFDLIEDELQAERKTYDTGLVRWSVWAESTHRAARRGIAREPKHPDRSRQRFDKEAEHAGQMLKRAGYVVPGFPSAADTDGFDYWMSAIAANVEKESDMSGDGLDQIGRSTSEHIGAVVHASKLLCALMATRAQR